ncbi:MAG: hypothetical protein QOG96_3866, partial [Pseudonocardiales bacterium]|nr:hypothetical protein [Pseudonocardiales bacterium]
SGSPSVSAGSVTEMESGNVMPAQNF